MGIIAPQASEWAGQMDLLFWTLVILTIFFTALVCALVLGFVMRYRRGMKVDRSNPMTHNTKLEMAWTIIPLIMALGMFVWSAALFADVKRVPDNAQEVFVIGKQWMWHIQHANGIRENNELHVPVGRPVKLTMISQDVIHDFFVPAFRMHMDVVPGFYTYVWYTPNKVGQYHILCGQYCGANHSEMVGTVFVMEPADYQAWLASGGNKKMASRRGSMGDEGERLYTEYGCVQCHGFAPARAPSLVGLYNEQVELDDGRVVRADDNYLRESILTADTKVAKGYQAIMPSFRAQLNEDEVLQLVTFIKSLSKEKTSAPTPAPEGTSSRMNR